MDCQELKLLWNAAAFSERVQTLHSLLPCRAKVGALTLVCRMLNLLNHCEIKDWLRPDQFSTGAATCRHTRYSKRIFFFFFFLIVDHPNNSKEAWKRTHGNQRIESSETLSWRSECLGAALSRILYAQLQRSRVYARLHVGTLAPRRCFRFSLSVKAAGFLLDIRWGIKRRHHRRRRTS